MKNPKVQLKSLKEMTSQTMNDELILDLGNKTRSTKNSSRSFYLLLFTLTIIVISMAAVFAGQLQWNIAIDLSTIFSFTAPLFLISSILGFIFAIKSILKKVEKSIQKIIGLVGNMTFFILVLAMIVTIAIDLSIIF